MGCLRNKVCCVTLVTAKNVKSLYGVRVRVGVREDEEQNTV